MNGYVCFHKDKQVEVYADNSYQAQFLAQKAMGLKDVQRCMITVVLAEKDGEPVTHTPLD